MADFLINCRVCGNQVSNKADICPYCGCRLKMALGFKILMVILSLVVVSSFSTIKGIFSGNSSKSSQITYTLDIRPDSQKEFEKICAEYKAEYDKAANDLQRSTARGNRTRALRQQGLSSANNWIGTIDKLSINNDGKGVISIKINNNISVGTWNNVISDLFDNTLISEGTPLFESFSSLKKGSRVRFSGYFFPSSLLGFV